MLATAGQADEVTLGQIPFTPRARQTLELALREALGLGHDYIGTEHVLLGLVRDEKGVASRILRDLGFDADRIRTEVVRALGGAGRPTITAAAATVSTAPHHPTWPALEDIPQRRRFGRPVELIVTGWLLFALALGAGILVGWAIWGT